MTDAQYIGVIENRIAVLMILCIAMAILLIGIVAMFGLFYISNKKYQKELLELGRYTTNVGATIDDSIPDLLEAIINDSFTDYRIMVLEPRQELYINDEREAEIRRDLTSLVVNRLSPMSLDKLHLFYNINKIDEILADKIFIAVMNYTVAHNSMIRDANPGAIMAQQTQAKEN